MKKKNIEYYYLLYDMKNQEDIVYFGTIDEMSSFLGIKKATIYSRFSRAKTDKITVSYRNIMKRYRLERITFMKVRNY